MYRRNDPRYTRLLTGAVLVFWGWRCGLFELAAIMAVLVEAAPIARARWAVDDVAFQRIADASNILFLAAAVYAFSRHGPHGVFSVIAWLPILLYPLLFAQLYSDSGSLPLGALFMSLRKTRPPPYFGSPHRISLVDPYRACCLVAAGTSPSEDPGFYPVLMILAAWSIYGLKPARAHPVSWVLLIGMAGGLGYSGHKGLKSLQAGMESLVLGWFEDQSWYRSDPYRTVTALGHIRDLKRSERVVMQVGGLAPDSPRVLLRQASYQRYRYGTWSTPETEFETARLGPNGEYRLHEAAHEARSWIDISAFLSGGPNLLALPNRTHRIAGLPNQSIRRNRFGAIAVEARKGFTDIRIGHTRPGEVWEPEEADLILPAAEADNILGVATRLSLVGNPPTRVLDTLESFFAGGFRYSLKPPPRVMGKTALATFLNDTRSGHCEYYATATVLLLRAAGIPARYAAGYSVQEYSTLARSHLVRRRHAHSWALAYIDGHWLDFDFTPAIWAELEDARSPWWLRLYDLASTIRYAAHRWGGSGGQGSGDGLSLTVALVAFALLATGVWRRKKVRGPGAAASLPANRSSPADSDPIDIILHQMSRAAGPRRTGETIQSWWSRIRLTRHDHGLTLEMDRLLRLHYAVSYDPVGLEKHERREYDALIRSLTATLSGRRLGKDANRPGPVQSGGPNRLRMRR